MGGRRDGNASGLVYHQQTTRKKEHHDSWHSQYASLFVYVSSLHLEHMTCYIVRIVLVVSFGIYIHIYIPFYLALYIIYHISLSLLVMYNYAGGKGGAYDYEAYEAK